MCTCGAARLKNTGAPAGGYLWSGRRRRDGKEDAAKRSDLEVRITGLTGEIQVACGTL
ncbi:unnamed protein product, partial [Polarella glacialis]